MTTRLRLGRSYWLDAAGRSRPRWPSIRGAHVADIAIVGGGITGCAAAWLFARAGASVIVVDAHHVGRGSTAASTALLMQEPDADFLSLARRHGTAATRRIWKCARRAVADLRHALEDVGAPVLEALPSLYLTCDGARVADLKRELAARHRSGLPGRWVDGRRLRSLAGFGADAGIITPGNAQVDPYRACLAFARAAEKEGAKIFERSHVTRAKGDRDGVRLKIAGGATIAADHLVIATGYATPEFKPLPSRFRMMNTYVIATPRLSSRQRREIGFGDVMLWDTNHPYHYLRWTPDRRLLFGGLDRPRVPRATRPAALRRRTTELMETLASWYPSLENVTPEYAWEGLFATTPDGLPYVGKHHRYRRHLFALGYGGNGMTLGFLASQIVVRLAQGCAHPDDALFSFGRTMRARTMKRSGAGPR